MNFNHACIIDKIDEALLAQFFIIDFLRDAFKVHAYTTYSDEFAAFVKDFIIDIKRHFPRRFFSIDPNDIIFLWIDEIKDPFIRAFI